MIGAAGKGLVNLDVLLPWLAAAISFLGVLLGFGGVWYQVKRQWLLNSATTVTDFEARFISPEWKEYRVNCGLFVQAHQNGELVDLSEDVQVLGMFEHLALLTRRGAIDFEMVWSKFGWYYVRYYEGLTTGSRDLIQEIRKAEDDQTLWEEIEWMYNKVVREYRKRGVPVVDDAAPQRIEELLRQELRLRDYKDTRLARLRSKEADLRGNGFHTRRLLAALLHQFTTRGKDVDQHGGAD